MQGRATPATWGALAAVAIGLSGCTGAANAPPSSTSSTAAPTTSPRTSGVQSFEVPAGGRDWAVLVEDPKDTARVATDLEDAGLALTSTNSGIGMVTLRSGDDDVARRAKAVDGVAEAVTDRRVGWTPEEESAAPATGDLTPATDHPVPPEPPEDGDPLDGWLWGMDEIDVDGAHEVTTGRDRVRVGVIDSGVDAEHPDLAPVLDTGLSRSFVTDIPDIDGECEHEDCVDPVGVDDSGHGTHVAGTIAAAANGLGVRGVAPDVTLVDLRAGQDAGLVFLGPTANALTYAADQRLDVVNMSFYVDPWLYACAGGAKGDTSQQAAFQDVAIEVMERALTLAHEQGVTIVAAAGNSAMDVADPGSDDTSPNYGDEPHRRPIDTRDCQHLPLDGEHVIGVASTDEGGARSTFSNWTSDPGDGRIDVAAPGGEEPDGLGGILSAAPRAMLRAQGEIDDEGRITVDGSEGVVRDCPGDIGPGDPDPDDQCGFYVWLQGTSMAAPHVSGVAALIISAEGDRMEPTDVAERLADSARDMACPDGVEGGVRCVGTSEDNGLFGAGMVDAASAVR